MYICEMCDRIWENDPLREQNDFSVQASLVGNILLPNWYFLFLAYTHAKLERLEALLSGRVCCLKAAT